MEKNELQKLYEKCVTDERNKWKLSYDLDVPISDRNYLYEKFCKYVDCLKSGNSEYKTFTNFLKQDFYDSGDFVDQVCYIESCALEEVESLFDVLDISEEEKKELSNYIREDDNEYFLYEHIDFSISLVLDEDIRVNLYMAGQKINDEDRHQFHYKKAIELLVEQQGYRMDDVMEPSDNIFCNSVFEELNEYDDADEYPVCILLKMDLEDLDKLAWSLVKDKKIIIKEKMNPVIGLVDSFYGGGSILDISLEKDLVFPSSYLDTYLVQFEDGLRHTMGNYTVDEIYGLIDSAWTPAFDVEEIIKIL